MRKLIALVFVLVLIPVVCLGELAAQIPLERYTEAELVALYETIHQEIINRGLENSVFLPEGTYSVKNMFPVGTYRVSITDKYQNSLYVKVTKTEEAGGETKYYSIRLPDNAYTLVEIEEDDEEVNFYLNTVWTPVKSLFE